ncbi:MAG: exodeoxyribonuclease VII small subunit [Bacilli bacterium]|jgi:exodeoxyribonuclease VII, small subunit|nr:exodeoxyribonuclease VII small subunit [Clostridium sp.]MDY6015917.1 exodeoxyribonuclease VII small subunit [Bacilli bacterium]
MAKEELNFEESLKKLEEIVKELENGTVALDDAITKFTEAMKLASSCNEKLKNAEESINKILTKDGSLEDFKVEE